MQLQPIGIIHSPFKEAKGTPLNPKFAKGVRGTVEVFDAYAEGLKDLDGFDRIWLVFWFDRAAPTKLITPVYLDSTPHGIFATRAPSRPNPIGLSCVKLLGIQKNILEVEEIDILDGTPLLDIKPYSPHADIFEVHRSGWLDAAMKREGMEKTVADNRFFQPGGSPQ
jgi:tRNA-Thr(GGU) m(6)t(6)A37 methyltransferase TsaA